MSASQMTIPAINRKSERVNAMPRMALQCSKVDKGRLLVGLFGCSFAMVRKKDTHLLEIVVPNRPSGQWKVHGPLHMTEIGRLTAPISFPTKLSNLTLFFCFVTTLKKCSLSHTHREPPSLSLSLSQPPLNTPFIETPSLALSLPHSQTR
ncbi:hypothetical protein AMTRI_Chr07g78160 [Amborella trichopoda]